MTAVLHAKYERREPSGRRVGATGIRKGDAGVR
jgi:hypothetical protein